MFARTVIAEIEDPGGEWPLVGDRMLRPESIVSVGAGPDAPGARVRLLEAIAGAVSALVAGPVPGLVWIDDLHLADDATREAVAVRDLASLFTCTPPSPEYADYATAHVHELIQRFSPSVLWNDIGWPASLDPNDVIGHYYSAVPDGVVNDRFNMIASATGQLHCDFHTPEYSTKASAKKWEVCRGIGRSFGYNRMENESTFPSVDDNIWMMCDIVARGGNLLLNVGPSADGQIPMAQVVRLTAQGWWLRVNGDAIYGTTGYGTATTGDGREVGYTARAGTSYAIVKGAPADEVSFPFVDPGAGAEVRMLGTLGANAVGMSTVMEAIAAHWVGMRVVGVSLVTNKGAGLSATPLTHEEVLVAANEAGPRLARVLSRFIRELPVHS